MPSPEIALGIQDDPRALCLIGHPVSSDLGDLLDDWTTVMILLGGAPVYKERGCCYLGSLVVGFVHVSCRVCS